MDELDITSAERKATYAEIKDYWTGEFAIMKIISYSHFFCDLQTSIYN